MAAPGRSDEQPRTEQPHQIATMLKATSQPKTSSLFPLLFSNEKRFSAVSAGFFFILFNVVQIWFVITAQPRSSHLRV